MAVDGTVTVPNVVGAADFIAELVELEYGGIAERVGRREALLEMIVGEVSLSLMVKEDASALEIVVGIDATPVPGMKVEDGAFEIEVEFVHNGFPLGIVVAWLAGAVTPVKNPVGRTTKVSVKPAGAVWTGNPEETPVDKIPVAEATLRLESSVAEARPLEVLFPKYNPFDDVKGRRPVVVAGRVAFSAGRVKLEIAEGLAKPDEIPVPVGRIEFALTPPFPSVVALANGAPDLYGK